MAYDEATDEFASYFNRQTSPKILITTSDRPHGVNTLIRVVHELDLNAPFRRVKSFITFDDDSE